jgi:hypothetical protein
MGTNRPMYDEETLNRKLDELFAAYAEACPTPETSSDFMPKLWQKIEAGRSASYSFGRWTRAFVTAAAAICLLLGLLQVYLPSQPTFYSQTYIEALMEENPAESATLVESLWGEDGGPSFQ